MGPPAKILELQRQYDQQIRIWFGEVRPLRLEGTGRFFTPPPAMALRAVFVPPALSPTYLQPLTTEPEATHSADALSWLEQHHRLAVLGDPGSGKSTLVSWLAWRLCAGLTEPMPAWCEGMLPVPMILRDMALRGVSSFDDLIAAHCATELIAGHPALGKTWATELRARMGQQPERLLFLIDGLDELPAGIQSAVRDAIRDAMRRLPMARFLVTSRIIGYEQNAIEASPMREPPAEGGLKGMLVRHTPVFDAAAVQAMRPDVQRLYVVPFDDARIRQFARNWFLHGEAEGRRGDDALRKFVDGLMRDPVARQLARIPNLLVMAAQVFGINNTLPDGRAKLYANIAKAYLESIDQLYGLVDARYSPEQKNAWLAAVGYRMQLRRGSLPRDNARELLIEEAEVVGWLLEAMHESGLEADPEYARRFIDAIARRSGLFIPRGEGLYAFAHLSIQEYFAALHLQARVNELAVADPEMLESVLAELAGCALLQTWREALITFYELPGWTPRTVTRLVHAVFGADFERLPAKAQREQDWSPPNNAALVELLARLVVNPGVAMPEPLRQRGFERVAAFVRDERSGAGRWGPPSGVLAALTGNEAGAERVWSLLRADPAALSGKPKSIDLRGARLLDYQPLSEFAETESLHLADSLIADLQPLAGLKRLTELDLSATPVQDLSPIANLPRLRDLRLSSSEVRELDPLRGLHSMYTLLLEHTKVEDLRPLTGLRQLRALSLVGTPMRNCEALASLPDLEDLDLWATQVEGLAPLSRLTKLKRLRLQSPGIDDLSPLQPMAQLESLTLYLDRAIDLHPIGQLTNLGLLILSVPDLRDLRFLASLNRLDDLWVMNARIGDLSPLAELPALRTLSLYGSHLRNRASLKRLGHLRIEGLEEAGPSGEPN